jgi:nitroimidazol reductase NimA-like FMN-containing flavoprotein (pyridoxamine 5'-phosphate oxidase superfamily)
VPQPALDIEKTIREYLPQAVHMSLGTCNNNKPWVCEVHFAYDNDLNFYFVSLPSTRHCQEIAANPYVAANIVTQHHLNQKVRGVYLEGRAEELHGVDENHPAYQAFEGRFHRGPGLIATANTPEGAKFHRITVSDLYVFDGYTSVPSQKYHLVWGK